MKLRYILIALIILLLALLVGGWWSSRSTLQAAETEAKTQTERADAFELEVAKLQTSNSTLAVKNDELRDSITTLSKEIARLQNALRDATRTISSNQSKISEMRERSNNLVSEIYNLKRQLQDAKGRKASERARLEALEDERFDLDKRIANMSITTDSLKTQNLALIEEVVFKEDLKNALLVKDQILDLINAIDVNFRDVKLLNSKGKETKRSKKWTSTDLFISLDAGAQTNLLEGNTFEIRLADASGTLISPRESGSSFDAQGVEFQYNGNLQKVTFPAYQKKNGKAFTFQVYLKNQGTFYPLSQGIKTVTFKR